MEFPYLLLYSSTSAEETKAVLTLAHFLYEPELSKKTVLLSSTHCSHSVQVSNFAEVQIII